MSRGINKVTLLGNLGSDPDLRYLPNGTAVTNFNVATGEKWKDKETGEPQERTEWHRVAIFGNLAEIAAQYLAKGSKVYLEGMLQTRKWQDKEGIERYTTEILVKSQGHGVMEILDSIDPNQQRPNRQRTIKTQGNPAHRNHSGHQFQVPQDNGYQSNNGQQYPQQQGSNGYQNARNGNGNNGGYRR